MKFNWGTGIFIFYSVFVLTLVFIVYQSTKYDNTLVVEDYYVKDLAYQQRFDKLENSKKLKEKLQIYYLADSDQIQLRFPDQLGNQFEGELLMYRPDSKTNDILIPVKTDVDNDMMIDVSEFLRGRWKVQVDWSASGKLYYDEKIIQLRIP